jgi:hypothetical protein
MNSNVRRKTQCLQAVLKLITSLHSKRYRQSGMHIHRHNSYAPRSKRPAARHEAQSREPVNKVKKKLLCVCGWVDFRASSKIKVNYKVLII